MRKINFFLCALLMLSHCGKDQNENNGDALPGLSIADASTAEGNGTGKFFVFDISLSRPFAQPVSVSYSTAEGSARAGEDFIAVTNGTVTFAPSQTSAKVSVSLVGDDIREGDEWFLLRLSSPANARIIRETATATITNDDIRISFTTSGYQAPATYTGYNLVWSDEFDGPSLNGSYWSFETGDGCPGLCGWGNNELQYYTSSAENLFFQDGKMIIEAKQQSLGGKAYTSARIKTADKKTFRFGRIDIRAVLPKGKGIWPAFWMMPQASVFGGWPRSGELDIMEMVGHEPGKVHGTLHFGPGPGSTQITKTHTLASGDFSDAFHVFSIEWQQDVIRWYVDGTLFGTAEKAAFGSATYPFNEQFYLIINLAVGGNWPGAPDASTRFPQYMIVDYVRVFQ